MAGVPVDSGPALDATPYVGRRRAVVELDPSTIARVLSDLEPVDHTTSFEHEPTARLPLLRDVPLVEQLATPRPAPATVGKRRAVRRARRGSLVKALPSAPVVVGVAALAVAVGGAAQTSDPEVARADVPATISATTALNGTSATVRADQRPRVVTRGGGRTRLTDSGRSDLKVAAEGLARARDTALTEIAIAGDKRSKVIAKDLWVYPLEPVILTARFGQYGLWSSYHTGLDFNGDTGDAIHAIADGVVTSAGYDGSYGNKTVVTLADGTELWYCHQTAIEVSVGDTVRGGEVIGLVGSTGNVTGSHLHVEVRPGGGDPVDPYPAMQQHGLF